MPTIKLNKCLQLFILKSFLIIKSFFLYSRHQFAQLIQLQKRLGKDEFPLVEQAYYPNYKEMVSDTS